MWHACMQIHASILQKYLEMTNIRIVMYPIKEKVVEVNLRLEFLYYVIISVFNAISSNIEETRRQSFIDPSNTMELPLT